MRDFACPNCGQQLAFENSRCLSCSHQLGFDLASLAFHIVGPDGSTATVDPAVSHDPLAVAPRPGPDLRRCANVSVAGCNWLVPQDGPGPLCRSCSLTRTRPGASASAEARGQFGAAEAAKRRLVVELSELGLPIADRIADPHRGLVFDLLSSEHEPVITGHADGVITLDLAEGDDVHREQLRVSMDEPYRTLLGHFRHETGHYYFLLAEKGPAREEFERLFGDPDADYQAALDRHYSQGAPAGWERDHVSSYATMHPAEDWAETFAHYLHIRDALDTAAAFGFAPAGATADHPLAGDAGFDRIIELWLPLSWSLNMINRSMGHADLYPFVLAGPVLDKMRLVHRLVAVAG